MSDWQPPDGVPMHCGQPQPANAYYFATPPKEIGTLLSASTNVCGLRLRQIMRRRWLIGYGIPMVCFVIGFAAVFAMAYMKYGRFFPDDAPIPALLMALIVGVLLAILASVFTCDKLGRHPVCSFVGDGGFAHFIWVGGHKRCHERILCYSCCETLYLAYAVPGGSPEKCSVIFKNATETHLNWTVRGQSKKHYEKPGQFIPFLRAMEKSWTDYRRPSLMQEYAESNYVDFELSSGGNVRVRCGQIEIHRRKKQIVYEIDEMEHCGLKNQAFCFKAYDESIGSGIAIAYGDVGNAMLLETALDRIALSSIQAAKKTATTNSRIATAATITATVIDYRSLPTICPACGTALSVQDRKKGLSPLAWVILLLFVPLTILWGILFYVWTHVLPTDIIRILIYAWPLIVAFLIARLLPVRFKYSCPNCQWQQSFLVRRKKRSRKIAPLSD